MSEEPINIHTPPRVAAATYGGADPIVLPADVRYKPATDFYKFINNKWQSHIHLPPYYGSFGVSEEIEDGVQNTLIDLISTLRETEPTHPISLFATSFLHTSAQHNSVVDLQRLLNRFDCISNADDVAHYVGILNKLQSQAPLSIVVSNDSYNSQKCAIYLYEPYLGLPDFDYYKQGARNHIILKYSKLLSTVGKIMNLEHLEAVIPFEASIIPFLTQEGQSRNISFTYNPHSMSELESAYKHIPWRTMLHGWGMEYSVYSRATFIVTNKAYLSVLNRMFRTLSLDMWRTWMRAQLILTFLEYLPPPFDDMHFELFGKALKGNTQKLPQKALTVKVLQTFTTHDLGKIFVKHGVPNGTKAYATRLVKKLKRAVIQRLSALEWMAASTKAAAIKKVDNMKFQVAFPDKWESETKGVPIDPFRPLLNIINLNVKDSTTMIHNYKLDQCTKNEDVWEDGTFEVNAYYYPEGNMMVVPAGILRPPFFDLKRSLAWNLGGIGAAIGHEITHGFDAEGRMYDDKGNYKNWWTDADAKTFTHLAKAIIKLFDNEGYMGGKVDGELTLSENIADLGGLAIALQALKNELGADPAVRKKAYRDFFTSYAVSWRNKDRSKKAKQSLLLDAHAPAPLRVNLIVRQFEEFYLAFDVKSTDEGYIAPELRISLW